MRQKWVGWSRTVWGNVLMVGGAAGVALSAATPDTVVWIMQPWLELASVFGWEPEPEMQARAVRGVLAIAAIVGMIAKARAIVHPDPPGTKLTPLPSMPADSVGSIARQVVTRADQATP